MRVAVLLLFTASKRTNTTLCKLQRLTAEKLTELSKLVMIVRRQGLESTRKVTEVVS